MTKKKPAPKSPSNQPSNQPETPPVDPQDYLVLGHLIKYNLYMLAKTVVFSAISKSVDDTDKAVEITHRVMQELDLDTKRRNQASEEQDSIQ